MSVTGTTIGRPWKPRPKRSGAAAGVNPLHSVRVGRSESRQRYPGIIVYVKQSARHIRSFRRFCEQNRLAVVIANGAGGKQAVVCVPGIVWDQVRDASGAVVADGMDSTCTVGAWEVLGSRGQLDELSVHPCLLRWHPVLSIGIMSCAGSGPEKIVTAKKHKDPEEGVWTVLHNEYREKIRLGELKEAADILVRLGVNTK